MIIFAVLEKPYMVLNKHHVLGTLPLNKHHEFLNTKSDSSLFRYVVESTVAYFLVYVNDLIITDSIFVASIIQKIGDKFSLKDLEPLHFSLALR